MATASMAEIGAPPMTLPRHLALASFWFGLNFHWIPILAILIPYQVTTMLPRSQQGTGIAVVTGLGAIFAMVLPPLVGAWSDRLTTRWGRRRPIMAVGVAGNVAGLLILMFAPSYPLVIAGYLVIQIFNNSAGAAFNATVPDVVPAHEFGRASGVLGAMVQVGSVCGLVATLGASLAGHITWTYGVIAVVIVLTLLPTLAATRGEGMGPGEASPPMPLAVAARRFLAPLRSGDFAWVIYTRMAVTAGIYCVLPFLQLFFRDVVHVANPADFTARWELILLLAAIPLGLAGGWLSDRRGRKPFVYASGALMTAVVIVYAVTFTGSQALVLGMGALYGFGYGLYYAVDWALACDTLPDRTRPAKDMGLFHVAFALPQVLVPAVAGVVIDAIDRGGGSSGYRVLLFGAAVFYLAGTLLVSRVRGVR